MLSTLKPPPLSRLPAAAMALAPAWAMTQFLVTAVFVAWLVPRSSGLDVVSFYFDPFATVPAVGMLVVAAMFARASARGAAGHGLHALFLLFVLAMAAGAKTWLSGTMHDVALLWGSHGRWGCRLVNADGSDTYFVTDSTLPLLLFAPAFAGTLAHWWTVGWTTPIARLTGR